MADTLQTTVTTKVSWQYREAMDLGNVNDSNSLDYTYFLDDGTTSGKADVFWGDTRSLATTANDDLDLTALSTTRFGITGNTTFVTIKGVYIVNEATVSGEDLVVGGSNTNPWQGPFGATNDTIRCSAGASLQLLRPLTGWSVSDGSADILRINNAGSNTNIYKIVIFGTSA